MITNIGKNLPVLYQIISAFHNILNTVLVFILRHASLEKNALNISIKFEMYITNSK